MPRAVRHITSIKQQEAQPNPISVIIPAASPGKRMKYFGARSLIQINGKNLLDRQITTINNNIDNCEIIIIIGFEYEKILNQYFNKYHNLRFVLNPFFDINNIGYSILLGLLNSLYNNILIIYGDLLFSKDTLSNLEGDKSKLVFENKISTPDMIGAIISQNRVCNLAYGLTPIWSQIAYLTGKEKDILSSLIYTEDSKKMFGHELIQYVINNGGEFIPRTVKEKIYEIDTISDYQEVIK